MTTYQDTKMQRPSSTPLLGAAGEVLYMNASSVRNDQELLHPDGYPVYGRHLHVWKGGGDKILDETCIDLLENGQQYQFADVIIRRVKQRLALFEDFMLAAVVTTKTQDKRVDLVFRLRMKDHFAAQVMIHSAGGFLRGEPVEKWSVADKSLYPEELVAAFSNYNNI